MFLGVLSNGVGGGAWEVVDIFDYFLKNCSNMSQKTCTFLPKKPKTEKYLPSIT